VQGAVARRGPNEVNAVTVSPVNPPSDRDIRESVEEELPELPGVSIDVREGIVTLTGTVPEGARRRQAERAAAGVHGVRAIRNELRVDPRDRPDRDIEKDIESALAADLWADAGQVDVSVREGHVTLRGALPSAAERTRAAELAWVRGVKSVDATGLSVQAWRRAPEYSGLKFEALTPSDLRAAVARSLEAAEGPSIRHPEIDVDRGAVVLRGEASTLHAKHRASDVASDVVGVKRVKNRLRVVPEREHTDAEVRERVDAALRRSPYLRRYEFKTGSRNGVLSLEGSVTSHFEKAQAERVASRVPGVLKIRNSLRVDGPGLPHLHDPYVDEERDSDSSWYEYRPVYSLREDAAVEESIESQLAWSPYVDADQVRVSVRNGVATLTGTVESRREVRAAVENAYDGGAVGVINQLETRR
jgi:osmotically-inducible protein OsmY